MINQKLLMELNAVIEKLNNLHRWTAIISQDKYNELSKQAFNCLIAHLLGCTYEKKKGAKLNWSKFPKIAIYRAFQKSYVFFDTPEYVIKEICSLGGIERSDFNKITDQIIEENTSTEFKDFLTDQIVNTVEWRIYRAATKIATYIELFDVVENQSRMEFLTRYQESTESLKKYEGCFPEVKKFLKGDLFQVCREISRLRNQNRWSVMSYQKECSVLGHLFDTAIWAWIMSLELHPEDENLAAEMFFMGIYHDVAETWTTDIQSPIKSRIPGFRKVIKEFEKKGVQCEIALDESAYGTVFEKNGYSWHKIIFSNTNTNFIITFSRNLLSILF